MKSLIITTSFVRKIELIKVKSNLLFVTITAHVHPEKRSFRYIAHRKQNN